VPLHALLGHEMRCEMQHSCKVLTNCAMLFCQLFTDEVWVGGAKYTQMVVPGITTQMEPQEPRKSLVKKLCKGPKWEL